MDKAKSKPSAHVPLPARLFLFAAGPLTVLILLIASFSLHAYLSLALMVVAIAFLLHLAGGLPDGRLEKTVLYGFAVACVMLMVGLPSGEVGHSNCPEATEGKGSVSVWYFYSPFCTSCLFAENSLKEAQKTASFSLRRYDLRYCKSQGSLFGFSATPCYAFAGKEQTKKVCGALSASQISQYVKEVS